MSGSSDQTSNRVYIFSSDYAWVPARLVKTDNETKSAVVSVKRWKEENEIQSEGGRLDTARDVERVEISLSDYADGVLPLQNVEENGKLREVEDMVDLPFLHEAAILYNLKARHLRGIPYTRTGDIVIAVNPYQWITGLYSQQKREFYAEKLVWNVSNHEGDAKSTVLPHVYETSSLAYRGMAIGGTNQSILVSGESGAGKTETVKILMSHLASIQGTNLHSPEDTDFRTSPIVARVLDSNPLLEAFGNAKTARNDNSSRFGKFIQLQFDTEDPTLAAYAGKTMPSAVLAGSKCEVYLLEKSRVVNHEEKERTYHIFYQLLGASEEYKEQLWDGLSETDNESFNYVGFTDTDVIEGKTDSERFQLTVDALAIVGVEGDRLRSLMRALCIVLQLGNLYFDPDPQNEEGSIIGSEEELDMLADLMGVGADDIKKALTERTMRARNEEYKVPLNVVKAKDSCDALAKEIYGNCFSWLVRTINEATCAEKNYDPKMSSADPYAHIGLLDIFGFESFEHNRFEQLCINYANEKLQQKFTLDIFRSVQSEYEFEGIDLGDVSFVDNADVLNLIEGRMGLISVLNEECFRPKGSDTAFVSKVYAMNRDSDCLIHDNFFRDYEFGVAHYAGPVKYEATNFVMKNMDTLPNDLVECAKKCSNELVSKEMDREVPDEGAAKVTKKASRRPARKPQSRGGNNIVAPQLKRSTSTLVAQTLWTKFRAQLTSLMTNIGNTRTRYIRCIKPNTMKQPKIMQHLSTVEQLRCAGVVAAVTISRSAFPNRLELEVVLDRFMCLAKGFTRSKFEDVDEEEASALLKKDVDRLLTTVLKALEIHKGEITVKGFMCGKTRAYFRAGSLEYLEAERLKSFGRLAIDIQRIVRGFLLRKQFMVLRFATIIGQKRARSAIARRAYKRVRAACVLLQCWSRCSMAGDELMTLRRNNKATTIQSLWRMVVARALLRENIVAVVKIQAQARGARQRPIYRLLLAEAIEEAKLENQLKALQQKLEEAEAKRLEAEKKASEGPKTVVVHKEESAGEKESEVTPAAAPSAPSVPGQLTEQQQTLMDESGKMLEYLRKEVFKLRSQNAQLRADFDLLKENNQRLMDANASAGASFAALNQHAKQLNKTNAKLMSEIEKYKEQEQKLNLLQVELKEELKMKQATYIAEVHSRLQYQKTLGRIVEEVQDRCRDVRLVEDILELSDECESDFTETQGGTTDRDEPMMPVRNDSSFTARFKSLFG